MTETNQCRSFVFASWNINKKFTQIEESIEIYIFTSSFVKICFGAKKLICDILVPLCIILILEIKINITEISQIMG